MDVIGHVRLSRKMWRASREKYNGETPPSDADGIVAYVLGHVPVLVKEAYEEDGVQLEFCPASDVINASYVAQRLQGSSRLLSRWEASTSVGTYRPGLQLIQVSHSVAKKSWLDYPTDWKDHVDTAGHEVGHYVDYLCGHPHRSRGFFSVWASERRKFDSYTSDSPSEYFADTFWMCCMYPEVTAVEIPNTHAWFSEWFAG